MATKVNNDIERHLWETADQLRANSSLMPSEYSSPVLGLLFLRYAENRYAEAELRIGEVGLGARRKIAKEDYHAEGIIFLPPEARFSCLQLLPEGENLGLALNQAMQSIEAHNPDLSGILPKTFTQIDDSVLVELLKLLSSIDIEGDAFGRVYEYFMGKFAMQVMQKGGEFYTPSSIVKLIVNVLEPYHGRIYDPACGSGGMFVHSAEFVHAHKRKPQQEISLFGVEKRREIIRMATMNLAIHGLAGDIREANTYYADPHSAVTRLGGKFDFVLANPPFNEDKVNKERLKDDPRFPFGLPTANNANYLWVQVFYSALNENGRAGFVMPNSAADAKGSELEIRKKLIQSGDIDVVLSVASNFFYTVTLPCTLWFFDRGKPEGRKSTVLFLDARSIYNQVDRAHRNFTSQQLEFLANVVRMYRGDVLENIHGGIELLRDSWDNFAGNYENVSGLCFVATIEEIDAQEWSLNPGRYVGLAEQLPDEIDFTDRLKELNDEYEQLNAEAVKIETQISENITMFIEEGQ